MNYPLFEKLRRPDNNSILHGSFYIFILEKRQTGRGLCRLLVKAKLFFSRGGGGRVIVSSFEGCPHTYRPVFAFC